MVKKDHSLYYKENDFMGIGMEILFKRKPELLEAFIQARK
jgi:hypothetical protein